MQGLDRGNVPEEVSFINTQLSGRYVAVTKTSSRGSSLRMTLPKEVAEKLNVSESERIGFYEVKGVIVLRKIE